MVKEPSMFIQTEKLALIGSKTPEFKSMLTTRVFVVILTVLFLFDFIYVVGCYSKVVYSKVPLF